MNDMIQIKLAVEGMKVEIIKAFDVVQISKHIRQATEKAVDGFDMETYIKSTVEGVFECARELVIVTLSKKYGSDWADNISTLVDEKITEALSAKK